ncbi:MAG: membrane integrity-associated transporter subunit PqiC [Methylobacter sp.]|nr:MAG: membrane integrity-associated transporter subunit PqiC [Methylobacter sp.]
MAKQLSKWFIAVSASTLLSACMSTPTQFYVLEPLSEPPHSSSTADKKRQIGVGPVSIPALLERKQIVTRLPDNSVKIAEFHQWASPLKDNVSQVLTRNLATLQTGDLVRAYPWSAYGAVDYRIIIDIIRFDTRPEQSVNLEADWAIMNEKNHTLLSNGRTKIEHQLDDPSYPAAVKALDKILSEFSQELSQALGKIQ